MDLLREIVSSAPSGSSINDEDAEQLSTDTDGQLDKTTTSNKHVHFMCEDNIEYSDSSNDNHIFIEQGNPSSMSSEEPVQSQQAEPNSTEGSVASTQKDVSNLCDTDIDVAVAVTECPPQVTDGVYNSQSTPPLTEEKSSVAIDKKPSVPAGKRKVRKRTPSQLHRKNSKHNKQSPTHGKSPVVKCDNDSGSDTVAALGENKTSDDRDQIGDNKGTDKRVLTPVQHIEIPNSLLDMITVDNTDKAHPSKANNKHKSKKLLSRRRPQNNDNGDENVDVLEQKYAELYSLLRGSGQISMTSVTGHVQQLLMKAASLQANHKKQNTSFDASDEESLSTEDLFQHGSLTAWEPLVHLPVRRCDSDLGERGRTRSRQSKHYVNGMTKHIYGEPLRRPNKTGSDSKLVQNKKTNSLPNMLHSTVGQTKDTKEILNTVHMSSTQSISVPVVPVDHHLKTSPEPAIQAWLRTKNQLYRAEKQKKHKKKVADRHTKQEALEGKVERAIQCEEAQRAWFKSKNKESRHAKKKEKKLTEAQNADMTGHQQVPLTGTVKGDSSAELQDQTSKEINTKPDFVQSVSETKFVYKRPVSGSIRLKVPKPSKGPHTRDTSPLKQRAKTPEVDSSNLTPVKTRMSYDQWLIQKRENDKLKLKEKEKQNKLAMSDPELDKLIPELARKRIDNILNSKKRVDCNLKGADEGDINTNDNNNNSNNSSSTATPSFSYRLPDTCTSQDTVSATEQREDDKTGVLKVEGRIRPRPCKSPDMRRPVSASSGNPFRLPFPPELGVPRFVAERQQKLFSQPVDNKHESVNLPHPALSPPALTSDTDSNTVLSVPETVLDTPKSDLDIKSLTKTMTSNSNDNYHVKEGVSAVLINESPPPPDIVQSSRVFITNGDDV